MGRRRPRPTQTPVPRRDDVSPRHALAARRCVRRAGRPDRRQRGMMLQAAEGTNPDAPGRGGTTCAAARPVAEWSARRPRGMMPGRIWARAKGQMPNPGAFLLAHDKRNCAPPVLAESKRNANCHLPHSRSHTPRSRRPPHHSTPPRDSTTDPMAAGPHSMTSGLDGTGGPSPIRAGQFVYSALGGATGRARSSSFTSRTRKGTGASRCTTWSPVRFAGARTPG